MSSPQSTPPKVFISYSHDSREHVQRVLVLSDRLRADGIDCHIDQYELVPEKGWTWWMLEQIKAADFVLVVCTETYCRRFEGEEEIGKGQGATYEGAIINALLYRHNLRNKKFIPILFEAKDITHVPILLGATNYYQVFNEEGYEDLYRRLTNQHAKKPDLGKLRPALPLTKRQDFPIARPDSVTPILPPINQRSFREHLGHGVELEMIRIEAGTFVMGSNVYDEEKPPHRVRISRPFYIGKYPVTQGQWQAVMGSNPSYFKGDNLPVEQVSWHDAVEFCQKLSDETGRKYRLPTEAEWEYAARAGSKGKYSFGDDQNRLGEYAWFDGNSGKKTHPVGQKKPNDWGLYDMHGNVWEWVQDWYGKDYYRQSVNSVDPQGPSSGNYRGLRGGSWIYALDGCRASNRVNGQPGVRYSNVGFRLVGAARTQ